ncbi:aromatic-ring-hydroxylating dioxygenase subunit beta [Halobellus rufus]|uniref:aromatic-ring-hydroxylating dioxygenase subunit beta n=1 Tax=Halobellus rufus TaxID=1448860 RepID=UPI0006792824|nr:aromatic-ring-hydroxylating dioxygenase subunit beta [Halobellus rufus]
MTTDEKIRDLRHDCVQFLNREAEVLDDRHLTTWIDMLTDDVEYLVPRRVTVEAGSEREFSENSFHYQEDRASLNARVNRFETDHAWSEDPPSRTRRFVSNVRVEGVDGDDVPVKSNLLVYRTHGNSPDPDLIAGERHDVLRRVDGSLKLASRRVLLDTTVLDVGSLSIFL